MAYQCGSDLSAISEENLAKTFASINPKGDGKLTFDDFYKWLKSGGDLKAGEKGSNFGLLRLKLSSKAWLKRFEKPAAAGSGGKAAGSGGKSDAKAAASASGGKADAKAAPADQKDMKLSKYVAFTVHCTALHCLCLCLRSALILRATPPPPVLHPSSASH